MSGGSALTFQHVPTWRVLHACVWYFHALHETAARVHFSVVIEWGSAVDAHRSILDHKFQTAIDERALRALQYFDDLDSVITIAGGVATFADAFDEVCAFRP